MENKRSETDRRRLYRLSYFRQKGKERRSGRERRVMAEQRAGWVRVGRWGSACLQNLSIAKYLKL